MTIDDQPSAEPHNDDAALLDTWVDRGAMALICIYTLAMPLGTLDGLPVWALPILATFEWSVTIAFTFEYCFRIYRSTRKTQYLFSFYGIVDFLSIVPALVLAGAGFQEVRALRLLRLLRLAKAAKYSTAVARIGKSLKDAKEELVLFGVATAVVIYIAAVGIYNFEHEAQPDVFKSVFHSWWWAVATLTTVGYGDIYPITTGGRIFTSVVVFAGLGVVAVPTAIIASALSAVKNDRQGESSTNED